MRAKSIKKCVIALVGVAVGLTILDSFSELLSKTAEVVASARAEFLLASFITLLAYRVVNASGWAFVVRALGGQIRVARGVRIWLFSEAFRWLPGSVWGFFSRAYQGQKAGLNKSKAALSVPLELILTLLAWGFTSLTASLLSGQSTTWTNALAGVVLEYPLVLIVGSCITIAVASFLARAKRNKFSKKLTELGAALRLVKQDVSILSLVKVFLLYVGLCFYNGFCFYLCCQALGFEGVSLTLAIAANANAFMIGFFAVFAPGGLGIREGSLAAMLTPFVGLEAGLACALVWRAIQLFVEILCLATCLLTNRVEKAIDERKELEKIEILKINPKQTNIPVNASC